MNKAWSVKLIKLQPRTVTYWPYSEWEILIRKSWVPLSSFSMVCLATLQHGLCTDLNHSRLDLRRKAMMYGSETIEETFTIEKTPIYPPCKIINNFSITVSMNLANMMPRHRLIMFFLEPDIKNFRTLVTPKARLKCSQRFPRAPISTRNSMCLSLSLPLSTWWTVKRTTWSQFLNNGNWH